MKIILWIQHVGRRGRKAIRGRWKGQQKGKGDNAKEDPSRDPCSVDASKKISKPEWCK